MSTLLIKNGHVIDPANDIDSPLDILVHDGRIEKIAPSIRSEAADEIDAHGLIISPGLVDLQVHVREPGREDKETIKTASRAALAGGITSIVAMPNTNPVADNQSVIGFVRRRAEECGLINIYPTGAITRGQQGIMLAEMNELKQAGAVAVTDDGVDVQNEGLLRRAMEYAKTCGMVLMSHCETESLTAGGVMHEGWYSTRLGLPGVPSESEDLAVMKNILLARMTGARVHLLHNSTAGAAAAIAAAKKEGLDNITAEVAVQHFALTDEECLGYNTHAKMYPPLRSKEHVEAIIAAIRENVFDAFTTDHAPHTSPEKQEPFQNAAFGSTGLETSFAVMNTYLVKKNHLSLFDGLSKMSTEPARILNLPKGTLNEGADADIALFDTNHQWTVDPKERFSKGANCVFNGKTLTGRAVMTLRGGEIKYRLQGYFPDP